MSFHAHSICGDCWNTEHPDRQTPVTVVGKRDVETGTWEGQKIERCCRCGEPTIDGIFVRGDESEKWSRCSCEK